MIKNSIAVSAGKSQGVSAIFWAGLIAGMLDISFAAVLSVVHGSRPMVMLKSIAGGVLGRNAQQGGFGTAALGLGLHFGISFGAAAVYYAASRLLPLLNRYAVVMGLVYGVIVYEFMNLVVLPLSAYHKPVVLPPLWDPLLVAHLFCVGLPIALAVRWHSP